MGAYTLFLLLLFLRRIHVAVWQVLHRVVPLDMFNQVALHGEGELAERAREQLRRAVILHTRVALLMLFELAWCAEDFTTAVTAVRLCIWVHRLLVSVKEARLNKGRPALTALVLPERTLVCFELVWVCVCSFAAVAAEPPVFCQLPVSSSRCFWLGGAPLSLRRAA